MSNEQKITDALRGDGASMIDDSNHYGRRMFRCWLDGSYKGQAHYQRNCQRIQEAGDHWGKLRVFVVGEFTRFVEHEFNCSVGTALNAIKRAYPAVYEPPIQVRDETVFTEAQHLTAELMADARELVEEEIA